MTTIAGHVAERFVDDLGRRHRTTGPAEIHKDGSHLWFVEGRLHRDGLPAHINGKLVMGPKRGAFSFYVNGKRHRDQLPASFLPYMDLVPSYYQRGKKIAPPDDALGRLIRSYFSSSLQTRERFQAIKLTDEEIARNLALIPEILGDYYDEYTHISGVQSLV